MKKLILFMLILSGCGPAQPTPAALDQVCAAQELQIISQSGQPNEVIIGYGQTAYEYTGYSVVFTVTETGECHWISVP